MELIGWLVVMMLFESGFGRRWAILQRQEITVLCEMPVKCRSLTRPSMSRVLHHAACREGLKNSKEAGNREGCGSTKSRACGG